MAVDLKEDPTFFDRADSFIHLANEHCGKVGRGKVSASFMYGCARFQAWNAACWASSGEEMKAKRDETVKYFVEQYQAMLEEHMEEYTMNHAKYMKASGNEV
jgi:heme-binding NEAT domain protein